MSSIFKIILGFVVVLAVVTPEVSKAEDLNPPAYDPLVLENFYPPEMQQFYYNRAKRMKIAKQLQAIVKEIDGNVVALSPSQRDWLRLSYFDEIRLAGNRYTQKALDAQDTVEYATHIVKDLYAFNLLPLLDWLSQLAPPRYSLRIEMIYWTAVAKRLAGTEDLRGAVLFLAKKNSTLRWPGLGESGSVNLLSANMGLRSKEILESIVQPYLNGVIAE